MGVLRRYRWLLIGAGLVAIIVAFLAFRPDKIFVDDVVEESLSDAFTATTTSIKNVESTEAAPTSTPPPDPSTSLPSAPSTTTTLPPVPSDPIEVTSGVFAGIDHAATGTATVYQKDGTYALRFEDNTDIQNGPDLYVWMLADESYTGGIPSDYIDLGKIKGNVGGQNYTLPANFDPANHRFVMIWCLRFNVPFAGAPLS